MYKHKFKEQYSHLWDYFQIQMYEYGPDSDTYWKIKQTILGKKQILKAYFQDKIQDGFFVLPIGLAAITHFKTDQSTMNSIISLITEDENKLVDTHYDHIAAITTNIFNNIEHILSEIWKVAEDEFRYSFMTENMGKEALNA